MAIKILAYGDAGTPTGFERVMRQVLTYLHSTGRFDIVLAGLGYRGNPDFQYPFPVWPAEWGGDFFGMQRIQAMCERHQPDVMFVTQDIWNICTYMAYKPVELPAVCYFPVDTPNIKWSYAIAAGAMAEPVVYTNFGARETAAGVRDAMDLLIEGAIENSKVTMEDERTWLALPHPQGPKLNLRLDRLAKFQNVENWNVIPHGLDRSIYKPLSKHEVRKEWGINPDAFIVGSVNTNQFRKRQDTLLRIFAGLSEKVPNAQLVLYCNNSDDRGWDLQQLIRYSGISSKKIYLVHEQIDRDLTEKEMCELYNVCDVMVNTAGGEGWGLTSFEGAACGVAQLVPDWSATRELWTDHGLLLPVSDWRIEPRFLNTAHAIIDVQKSIYMLVQLAENRDWLKAWQDKAYAHALAQPSWTDVAKKFERVFFKAANQARSAATPRSFTQLLAERTGEVRSELAGALYIGDDGRPVRIAR